jgi:hypothetical protein
VFVHPLAEVASFVCESAPGVSPFAPIGTALDFDFIWDGYDIPFELLVRRSSPAPLTQDQHSIAPLDTDQAFEKALAE